MARTERPADHGGAASSLAIRPIRAHSILNHGVKVSGVQAISDCSLGELRVVLRLVLELEKVPAVCKDGRIIVADATIDLIPGKDGEGADGAVVTFVGVGAPWQRTAWRAALAPINLARRIWQRRPSR